LLWGLRSFSVPAEHIGKMDPIVPSCNTDQGVYRACERFWERTKPL
jgi:hypothetical protein